MLQSVRLPLQPQTPAVQVSPPAVLHAWPQLPQFPESVLVFVQTLLHNVSPPVHPPQVEAEQVWRELATIAISAALNVRFQARRSSIFPRSVALTLGCVYPVMCVVR